MSEITSGDTSRREFLKSTGRVATAPDVAKLTMDSPAPLRAGADGLYPTPQPGVLKDREY